MHLNTFEYKKNAIWYFLTGYNSILEYSRDVNTSEYKTNYNMIFLTGYLQYSTEYSKDVNTFEYLKYVQYDIFDRILQYSRVFKMRLNIQKFTIWYCRLDITVFQSIQNMWILLNMTNLQYIFLTGYLQYSRVFQMHVNTFEYRKCYNMIFLTGYYSIAEYSKCMWI